MRKSMFVIICLAIISMFSGCAKFNAPLTDEELAMKYVEYEYGDGDYTIEIYDNDNDDEFINFLVYSNGAVRYGVSMNKEYYNNLFANN